MQRVKLYEQPVMAEEVGRPPLTISVITQNSREETVSGPMNTSMKQHTYILYDVLPDELKRRVKLAIDALSSQF